VKRFSLAALACVGLLMAAFGSALSGAQQSVPAPTVAGAIPSKALIDSYCITCHNQRTKTAGLALDTLNPADVAAHADVWEEVVRKLRGGLMPPAGIRRPPQAEVDTFVRSLEQALDSGGADESEPGPRGAASTQSRGVRERD
jgi:cytochrome c551/c552